MRIKNSIKSLLKPLHRHKKSEPDVFIFSLPRAGSTLLTEILNTDPNSKTASEPLALNKDNIQVLLKQFDSDILAERYVDISGDHLHQMFNYFKNLSDGLTWNSYYWSDFFTPYHRFSTSRTLFKTQRVTYYYDDLMLHFKEDFGLYLLRHPVAHSLSRMSKEWSKYIDLYADSKKIKDSIPQAAKLKIEHLQHAGSKLDKFITSWCLENFLFLRDYQSGSLPSNVFPVFYEELVIDPEKTIKKLCTEIEMSYNDNMLSRLNIPSSGIIHSTRHTEDQIITGNKDYLVNRWKDSLDAISENQFKDILSSFGITTYLD